jgi:hypothetical protein
MGKVLTSSATITCSHGGTVKPVPSQQKLTVDGTPVLVDGDLVGATVSGCTNVPPPQGRVPCSATTSMSAGAATKLTVGGKGVLLDSASGQTNSTPAPGTFSVSDAGQTKLTAT